MEPTGREIINALAVHFQVDTDVVERVLGRLIDEDELKSDEGGC